MSALIRALSVTGHATVRRSSRDTNPDRSESVAAAGSSDISYLLLAHNSGFYILFCNQ